MCHEVKCSDAMAKGVGESIYSGFTHNPHHLILDSVVARLACARRLNQWCGALVRRRAIAGRNELQRHVSDRFLPHCVSYR